MLSAILLILSIAGVIANSAAGLHSARAQRPGVTGLKRKRQFARCGALPISSGLRTSRIARSGG